MRILIVSTFFPPLNSIASLRPYSWAKAWANAGHDVTVLTTTKKPNLKANLDLPNLGYDVIEVPLPGYIEKFRLSGDREGGGEGAGGVLNNVKTSLKKVRDKYGVMNACRFPDLTHLWIRPAYNRIKTEPEWDLVISSAGPYTPHLLGEKIKRNGLAKKWIADYRDTWSNSYLYPGVFPFNLMEHRWESRILKSADLVTTVSEPLATSIEKDFSVPHVEVIENGFDPDDYIELPLESIFPNDHKVRIVYTGSIYAGKRDPKPLFEAIQQMSHSDQMKGLLDSLEVIFVGANLEYTKKEILSFQVQQWVKAIGLVPREDALRMQRDAHQLLFLPWNDPGIDGILTGKLFEYLFSGTAICSVGGNQLEASQKLIIDSNAGISLNSTDEIIQYLERILSNPQKQPAVVKPEILQRYERKFLALRLLDLIQDK